jgi:hypothetical protein
MKPTPNERLEAAKRYYRLEAHRLSWRGLYDLAERFLSVSRRLDWVPRRERSA